MRSNPYIDYTKFYENLNTNGIDLNLESELPNPLRDINIPTQNNNQQTDTKETSTQEKVDFRQWLKDNDSVISAARSRASGGLEKEITDYINGLDIDQNYKNYLIQLAKRESGFNPEITNNEGYMGLFQFGTDALQEIDVTPQEYMSDWKKQVDAAVKWTNLNKERLAQVITGNIGRNWNGTKLTEYGILGAAHLGGVNGVTNLLLKGLDKRDSNNTAISDYLVFFSR